ncbi:MAG: hypothetical protein JXR79_01320 [Nitrospirae bacterium]|nr:hypothetical protein [Nitrospirota bacterium]
MKKALIAVLMVSLFTISCSQAVRYSAEEIKSYPADIQQRIIKGEVSPGMTQQQVRYAWGSPDSIRSLEPEAGKAKEEWIYSNTLGIFKTRLVFIDNKVVYIITSDPGKVE